MAISKLTTLSKVSTYQSKINEIIDFVNSLSSFSSVSGDTGTLSLSNSTNQNFGVKTGSNLTTSISGSDVMVNLDSTISVTTISATTITASGTLTGGSVVATANMLTPELEVGTGTPYVFPLADGTANQVMKTDGAGTLSWTSSAAATSYLSLTDTPSAFTSYRIPHTNVGATALTDTAGFTFDSANGYLDAPIIRSNTYFCAKNASASYYTSANVAGFRGDFSSTPAGSASVSNYTTASASVFSSASYDLFRNECSITDANSFNTFRGIKNSNVFLITSGTMTFNNSTPEPTFCGFYNYNSFDSSLGGSIVFAASSTQIGNYNYTRFLPGTMTFNSNSSFIMNKNYMYHSTGTLSIPNLYCNYNQFSGSTITATTAYLNYNSISATTSWTSTSFYINYSNIATTTCTNFFTEYEETAFDTCSNYHGRYYNISIGSGTGVFYLDRVDVTHGSGSGSMSNFYFHYYTGTISTDVSNFGVIKCGDLFFGSTITTFKGIEMSSLTSSGGITTGYCADFNIGSCGSSSNWTGINLNFSSSSANSYNSAIGFKYTIDGNGVAGTDATSIHPISVSISNATGAPLADLTMSDRGTGSLTAAASVRIRLNGTMYRLALYADA